MKDHEKLAAKLSVVFALPYPEELAPVNIIGRRDWRKQQVAKMLAEHLYGSGTVTADEFIALCK